MGVGSVTQGRKDWGNARVRSNLRVSTELRATNNLGTTIEEKETHRDGAAFSTTGLRMEDGTTMLL